MTNMEEKTVLYRVLTGFVSIVITISLAVSGWFIKENINNISNCQKDIIELKLAAEKVSASRFTASDWIIEKRQLDENRLQQEKRIVVVEENMRQVKELLSEIKADVKELKERN